MRRVALTMLAVGAVVVLLWALWPDGEDARPPTPPEADSGGRDPEPPDLPEEPASEKEAAPPPAADSSPGVPEKPLAILRGRVVRIGGSPVPDARVVFTSRYRPLSKADLLAEPQEGQRRFVRTDDRGRFEFLFKWKRWSPDAFTILAYAEDRMAHLPEIPDGEPPVDVGDLVLAQTLKVRVRVSKGAGEPLPDACVDLRASSADGPGLYVAQLREYTGAGGKVEFLPLPIEEGWTVFLTVSAAGVVDQERMVRGPELLRGEPIQVSFPVGMSVTGWVLWPGDRPAPGLVVRVMRTGERPEVEKSPITRTDEDGRFEIAGVPADGARLLVYPPPRSRWSGSPPFALDEIRGADGGSVDLGVVRLPPTATIRGVVVDTAGAPIPGASVGARIPPLGTAWEKSGADGRFEIKDLPPGDYEVTATKRYEGFGERKARVTGARPGGGDVTLRIAPGRAVVLRFHPADDPTAPLGVDNGSLSTEPGFSSRVFRSSGRGKRLCRIEREPGTYTIRFKSDGYIPVTIEGVEVTEDEDTLVDVLLEAE